MALVARHFARLAEDPAGDDRPDAIAQHGKRRIAGFGCQRRRHQQQIEDGAWSRVVGHPLGPARHFHEVLLGEIAPTQRRGRQSPEIAPASQPARLGSPCMSSLTWRSATERESERAGNASAAKVGPRSPLWRIMRWRRSGQAVLVRSKNSWIGRSSRQSRPVRLALARACCQGRIKLSIVPADRTLEVNGLLARSLPAA